MAPELELSMLTRWLRHPSAAAFPRVQERIEELRRLLGVNPPKRQPAPIKPVNTASLRSAVYALRDNERAIAEAEARAPAYFAEALKTCGYTQPPPLDVHRDLSYVVRDLESRGLQATEYLRASDSPKHSVTHTQVVLYSVDATLRLLGDELVIGPTRTTEETVAYLEYEADVAQYRPPRPLTPQEAEALHREHELYASLKREEEAYRKWLARQ